MDKDTKEQIEYISNNYKKAVDLTISNMKELVQLQREIDEIKSQKYKDKYFLDGFM